MRMLQQFPEVKVAKLVCGDLTAQHLPSHTCDALGTERALADFDVAQNLTLLHDN